METTTHDGYLKVIEIIHALHQFPKSDFVKVKLSCRNCQAYNGGNVISNWLEFCSFLPSTPPLPNQLVPPTLYQHSLVST